MFLLKDFYERAGPAKRKDVWFLVGSSVHPHISRRAGLRPKGTRPAVLPTSARSQLTACGPPSRRPTPASPPTAVTPWEPRAHEITKPEPPADVG